MGVGLSASIHAATRLWGLIYMHIAEQASLPLSAVV